MDYSEMGGSRSSFTTVGTTTVQVISLNKQRKKLILVNDSNAVIYLAKGTSAAVVGSGIRLNANGGNAILEPDAYGRIWRGAIQAIANAAGSNLSWQEDW